MSISWPDSVVGVAGGREVSIASSHSSQQILLGNYKWINVFTRWNAWLLRCAPRMKELNAWVQNPLRTFPTALRKERCMKPMDHIFLLCISLKVVFLKS
jgi:hypothetical protein